MDLMNQTMMKMKQSLKMKKRMKSRRMKHLSLQNKRALEVALVLKKDLMTMMMIVAPILQRRKDKLQKWIAVVQVKS